MSDAQSIREHDDAVEDAHLNPDSWIPWGRGVGIFLSIASFFGLAASLMLSVDKVRLLENPLYVPSCNFNPVLSCGSVMKTVQAEVLGFPNPFIGLIGFSVMLALGVVVASGVKLPRWIIAGGALGASAGAVFIHWLAFQSLYRIGALCPWCMVVWVVTMPIALTYVLKALSDLPGALSGSWISRFAIAAWQWRFTILLLWYLVVAGAILVRFWDYWETLI